MRNGRKRQRPSVREVRAAEAAKQKRIEATAEFGQVALSFNRAAVVSHVEMIARGLPDQFVRAVASIAANEFQTRMRETLPGHVDQELWRAVVAAAASLATKGAKFGDAVAGKVTWTEDERGAVSAIIESIRSEPLHTWPNLLRSLPSGMALKQPEVKPLMKALRGARERQAKADLPIKTGRPGNDDEWLHAYYHRHSELKEQNTRAGVRAPATAARVTLQSEFAGHGAVEAEGHQSRLRRGRAQCGPACRDSRTR